MLFGGFLIYQTPRLRVFIDDRCELYGDHFLLDYETANSDKINEWIGKYNIPLALVETKSPFHAHLEKDFQWKKVKAGRSAVLYMRPVARGS